MSNVVTPEFRVSYPSVFQPKRNDLNGKDEFSVVALFPKGADLSALKAAAKAAVVEEWGPDEKKWPTKLRLPFRDQGEKKKDGVMPPAHEEGAIFMNLKSQQKPGVVDQNVQPILDAVQFYGGCYARASVRAYAYEMKGNAGVAFGLQNIQKTRDGDSLGGRAAPEKDFAPIPGAETGSGTATSLFS
jgi:hypothetical protein